MSSSAKVRFTDPNKSEFFSVVKKRVDAYFKDNNLSKHANAYMVFKTVLLLSLFVGFYLLIIFSVFPLWGAWLCAIGLGVVTALIGFNICHDAIHGAYSEKPWVNEMLGYMFNLVGANAGVWKITHNAVHHTYTNISGHDEDIEVAPVLLRLNPSDKKYLIQRFQHYYAFLLYGLASISWVLRKDYVKFFQPMIGSYDNSNKTFRDYFDLFFFKFLYYTLFIVIPLVVIEDMAWWQFLIGFVSLHIAEGLVLGLVFQLAHVVEGVDIHEVEDHGSIEESWAVHQMKTTANFAAQSPVASFFCGGLNQQIEHHLFPRICHIHYPVISNIVRETAHEYGVPYIENKTFFSALQSHYRVLKRLGPDSQKMPVLAGA